MEVKKRIGKRIQELRIKNNLKQSELAEMIDVAVKTQSCIETGKNYPTAENIEKYAKALNVDVADILNINHIKTSAQMLDEIQSMLKSANEEQILVSYRILKSLFF